MFRSVTRRLSGTGINCCDRLSFWSLFSWAWPFLSGSIGINVSPHPSPRTARCAEGPYKLQTRAEPNTSTLGLQTVGVQEKSWHYSPAAAVEVHGFLGTYNISHISWFGKMVTQVRTGNFTRCVTTQDYWFISCFLSLFINSKRDITTQWHWCSNTRASVKTNHGENQRVARLPRGNESIRRQRNSPLKDTLYI